MDVARLQKEYFERRPDLDDPDQMVASAPVDTAARPCAAHLTKRTSSQLPRRFANTGTSRVPTALSIWGKTPTVSEPAQRTALEVLAANNVETIIQQDNGITPTPVISRAILVYNRGRSRKTI